MKTSILFGLIFLALAASASNVFGRSVPEVELSEQQSLDFETKNALDDFIRAIINNFKDVIINGNKCLGIPPLDPLSIPVLPLFMNSSLLKMTGNITEIQSMGLSTLSATSVNCNIITLSVALEMEMSELYISGNYDVNGLAALLLPIYGRGPFFLRIAGVHLTGGGSLGARLNGSLFLKELDFSLEIGEIFAHFEGLLGGGELGDVLNQIVNDMGLTVYNVVMEVIHDSLTSFMLQFINLQLKDVLLSDIIGGIIKPPAPGTNSTCDYYY